ncbi:lipopolysaccharide biosynthesis [Halanaerobium saccharolyticum subsp. saccharolyticum DSM 6643]|uniref:Lipopolysaccharide biosynthesis n=1 Tax=Halanaerobium saccharolyticum subsp. saccharolyticum DSM 6643 TaxID=1293054 RepID=M5E1V5_9FIRM|nr:Wzz/FepE/Etk N-terminal domain-containing protein [Halanaerobium saccharolyticum]CCU79939.1 lipopolysaccharide biosynthesis [Halanaerobium saccharolyticum subsp. saccharolyticum DSM 6643]
MSQKENQRPDYYDEYEIDLREYVLLLWEHKYFIIGLTVLSVLISYVYSANFIIPNYQNSLTVQLSNTKGNYSETESINELLKSDELIVPALKNVDLNSNSINNINTKIISNLRLTEQGMQGAVYGGIISLQAESADQEKLYIALNAIINEFERRSNSYFEEILEEKKRNLTMINNEIENLDKEIDKTNEILNNFQDVSIDKAFIISSVNSKLNILSKTKREYLADYRKLKGEINDHRAFRVLNFPPKKSNKISPNIRLNIAIAAVLGLMLSVFIVFFKKFMKEE